MYFSPHIKADPIPKFGTSHFKNNSSSNVNNIQNNPRMPAPASVSNNFPEPYKHKMNFPPCMSFNKRPEGADFSPHPYYKKSCQNEATLKKVHVDDRESHHHEPDRMSNKSNTNFSILTLNKVVLKEKSLEDSEHKSITEKKFTETKLRHLVGTVEYVVQWYQFIRKSDVCVMYQVIGWLECIRNGKYWCQKVIFIRGEGGSVLQGIFYEIDRLFPHFQKGQLISCTGRMIGANKLHVLDTEPLSDEDRIGAHRAIFLSQRTVSNLANVQIE